ncbi:DUF6374 family protein [Nocardia niwae]|uniref:DUF6374 family protein n=1 Tax=Nocardia niwae TaxID=626084 RepID=UPI000AA94948|nr:DUF6374 family protein [Nocardia niwae]
MPELNRLDFAQMQVGDVRRLLDAAAFGKTVAPEQLEIMALGEGLRICVDATRGTE